MWRANLLEKTLMLGKTEGRRRGWQTMRRLDGITDSMDMALSIWFCVSLIEKVFSLECVCVYVSLSFPNVDIASSAVRLSSWLMPTGSIFKILPCFIRVFIWLLWLCLGCWAWAFPGWGWRGCSLVAACGLLIAGAFLIAEQGLQGTDSTVVAHGLSCPRACGIFQDQGSNPWQADS